MGKFRWGLLFLLIFLSILFIFVIFANSARVDSLRYIQNNTDATIETFYATTQGIETTSSLKFHAMYDDNNFINTMAALNVSSPSSFNDTVTKLYNIVNAHYYDMKVAGIDIIKVFAPDDTLLLGFNNGNYVTHDPLREDDKNCRHSSITKGIFCFDDSGLGVMFNYPIHWGGRYIGSVSFGITPYSYLKMLKRFSKMDYSIMLDQNIMKNLHNVEGVQPKNLWVSGDYSQFMTPAPSINITGINAGLRKKDLSKSINSGKSFLKTVKLEDGYYEVIFIPLTRSDGSIIGYAIKYNNTQLDVIIKKNILNSLISLLSILATLILFYIFFRDKHKKDSMSRILKGYHKTIDVSSIVITTDHKGQISYINDNFGKMSGYPLEDYMGKNIVEMQNNICDKMAFSDMISAVEQKRQWLGRLEMRRNPAAYRGTTFSMITLDVTAVPIVSAEDNILETIYVMHDITSLTNALRSAKEAELKLNETLDILSATVFASSSLTSVFDKDMRIVFSNWNGYEYIPKHIRNTKPYCYDVFPCSGSLLTVNRGESICDACHIKTVMMLKKPLTFEVVEEERDVYREKDIYPIFDKSGDVSFVVDVRRDIKDRAMAEKSLKAASLAQEVVATKLKETVQDLEVSKAEAERASKAKSLFLANMSHEIRTPINGIVGFLKLLKECSIDDTAEEYLEIINISTSSLIRVINDVLDFSKIESGKMELELSNCNPMVEIEPIADIFGAQAEERGIYIHFYMESSIPSLVEADSLRIRQVLINLVSNAVKFTPENGKVWLDITLNHIEDDMCFLDFSVTDTGIGMDDSVRRKIFDAFDQGDNSVTRRFGGTGLGLAISSSLLKFMGSNLEVESTLGKGSRFHFTLGLPILSPAEPLSYDGLKIFIYGVTPVTDAIKRYLDNFKCHVEIFNKLPDSNSVPDAIVIDYCSDTEILKRKVTDVRAKYKNVPIIVSSRATAKKYIEDENLSDIHIMRPITLSRMRNALDKVMKGYDCVKATSRTYVPETFVGTVLVVDDNDINLKLADIVMRNHGLAAVLASNGVEAVEACKVGSFDIIFMDIQMPVMDGMAATERIRSMGIDTPIIALTANVIKDDVERFMSLGMNGYLSKPINIDKLREILTKYLGRA